MYSEPDDGFGGSVYFGEPTERRYSAKKQKDTKCKFCGKPGLVWKDIGDLCGPSKWRLHEKADPKSYLVVPHICKDYQPKQKNKE